MNERTVQSQVSQLAFSKQSTLLSHLVLKSPRKSNNIVDLDSMKASRPLTHHSVEMQKVHVGSNQSRSQRDFSTSQHEIVISDDEATVSEDENLNPLDNLKNAQTQDGIGNNISLSTPQAGKKKAVTAGTKTNKPASKQKGKMVKPKDDIIEEAPDSPDAFSSAVTTSTNQFSTDLNLSDPVDHPIHYHDISPEEASAISLTLIAWYRRSARLMPWRSTYKLPSQLTREQTSATLHVMTSDVEFSPSDSVAPDDGPFLYVNAEGKNVFISPRFTSRSSSPPLPSMPPSGSTLDTKFSPFLRGWDTQTWAYRVWVSEVMLQQTRVGTVLNYYPRWMTALPTLSSLAKASDDDVQRLWAGLGFYRRARMLHQGAKYVQKELGGILPETAELLSQIPGIGPYTAGAIAANVFGAIAPAVDTNLIRVLARLRALRYPAYNAKASSMVWKIAQQCANSLDNKTFRNVAQFDLKNNAKGVSETQLSDKISRGNSPKPQNRRFFSCNAVANVESEQDLSKVGGTPKGGNVQDIEDISSFENFHWPFSDQFLVAEFNQSLMDLGASLCTIKNPKCVECPINMYCDAYAEELTQRRWTRKQKDNDVSNAKATMVHAENADDSYSLPFVSSTFHTAESQSRPCSLCMPVRSGDLSFSVTQYPPEKKKSAPLRKEHFLTYVLLRESQSDGAQRRLECALIRRPNTGLLAGQLDFPKIPLNSLVSPQPFDEQKDKNTEENQPLEQFLALTRKTNVINATDSEVGKVAKTKQTTKIISQTKTKNALNLWLKPGLASQTTKILLCEKDFANKNVDKTTVSAFTFPLFSSLKNVTQKEKQSCVTDRDVRITVSKPIFYSSPSLRQFLFDHLSQYQGLATAINYQKLLDFQFKRQKLECEDKTSSRSHYDRTVVCTNPNQDQDQSFDELFDIVGFENTLCTIGSVVWEFSHRLHEMHIVLAKIQCHGLQDNNTTDSTPLTWLPLVDLRQTSSKNTLVDISSAVMEKNGCTSGVVKVLKHVVCALYHTDKDTCSHFTNNTRPISFETESQDKQGYISTACSICTSNK